MKQGSLLKHWMDENMSQQSNKRLLTKETYNCSLTQQPKLARTVPTRGIETGALNR